MNWYLDVLKKYAVFGGRASRAEYWVFFLFNLIIGAVLGFFEVFVGTHGVIGMLYFLGVLIPGIAVSVRRLHDTDRSGWWFLLNLIPLIGALVFAVFMAQDGTPGQNQHGANPKSVLPRSGGYSQLAKSGSAFLLGGATTYFLLKMYFLLQPSPNFGMGRRLIASFFGGWLAWLIEPVTLTGRKVAFSPSFLFYAPLAGIVILFLIWCGIRLRRGQASPILHKILIGIGAWILAALIYGRAVSGFAYFRLPFGRSLPLFLADVSLIAVIVGIAMLFFHENRRRSGERPEEMATPTASVMNPLQLKLRSFFEGYSLPVGSLDEFRKGQRDFSTWGTGLLLGSKEWVIERLSDKLREINASNLFIQTTSENFPNQQSDLKGFTARLQADIPGGMLAGYYIGRVGDQVYGLFGFDINANQEEIKKGSLPISASLVVGIPLAKVIEILGPPSNSMGGTDVMKKTLEVGGTIHSSTAAMNMMAGKKFMEWNRPEGKYRLVIENGVLARVFSFPENI